MQPLHIGSSSSHCMLVPRVQRRSSRRWMGCARGTHVQQACEIRHAHAGRCGRPAGSFSTACRAAAAVVIWVPAAGPCSTHARYAAARARWRASGWHGRRHPQGLGAPGRAPPHGAPQAARAPAQAGRVGRGQLCLRGCGGQLRLCCRRGLRNCLPLPRRAAHVSHVNEPACRRSAYLIARSGSACA
jgi:hypothetical protein